MHCSKTMKHADRLRKLIRACVDDACTLRHERKFVNAGHAEALTLLMRERQEFIVALEQRRGAPERRPTGSWTEMLREARRTLWVTAAGPNSGDAISTCRHSRARTEACYDQALQETWPDETRLVLATHRQRLQDETGPLNHLQF